MQCKTLIESGWGVLSFFVWSIWVWKYILGDYFGLEDCFLWGLGFFFNIYLAAPGLSCGMWDLVPWPGMKPGSPRIGSESQPLDHLGSPESTLKKIFFNLIYFWVRWVFIAAGGLSLVAASRGCSSLQWLLLLRSTGSRHVGFSSCGLGVPECRLSSCGARA